MGHRTTQQDWRQFQSNHEPTLGIEAEVQVLDPRTLALSHRSLNVLELLPKSNRFGGEFQLNNLEVRTGICRDIGEAERDLHDSFSSLRDVQEPADVRFASSGMHPFSRWQDQQITPAPRPRALSRKLGLVGDFLATFGQHVHVGVQNGDMGVAVMQGLVHYLPHLAALSANSPFYEGRISHLMSMRNRIFRTLPRTGPPSPVANWSEWSALVDAQTRANQINSFKDLWWDVRLNPFYGTVEVRICDAPPSLDEMLGLAALIQALVVQIQREASNAAPPPLSAKHRDLYESNIWQAVRYGTKAVIADPLGGSGDTVQLSDAIAALLEQVFPIAQELGGAEYLARLEAVLRAGCGAERQLAVYRETHDLRRVVESLCNQLTTPAARSQEATSRQ